MSLTLTRREESEILRKRASKGLRKLNGRKLAETNTGKETRGREIDVGFRAYIRRQPCEARHLGGCAGAIEAAHVRYSDAAKGSVNPGMQRKNHDRNSNPLCAHHHRGTQHMMNERKFWDSIGLDAYDNAARHYATYLRVDQ